MLEGGILYEQDRAEIFPFYHPDSADLRGDLKRHGRDDRTRSDARAPTAARVGEAGAESAHDAGEEEGEGAETAEKARDVSRRWHWQPRTLTT